MMIFKSMITDNNNEELREAFFNQKIIRKLWPVVRNSITRDLCFPVKSGPNQSILPTYHEITREMAERGLPMPNWWVKEFPIIPNSQ
jgi:hypothetical protein